MPTTDAPEPAEPLVHPAAARFRIVDCHHHVGNVQGTLGLGGSADGTGPDTETAVRLRTMRRHGVDASVVTPGHGYLRPEGLADTRRVNDGIAAYRDAAPRDFAAAVGIVEPLYGPAGLPELVRIRDELGLVGVSFHARFQGVSTDSPLVRALLGPMGELGLVPFVHAMGEAHGEPLWQVQALARDFPDLTFLVLDCFSDFEQCRQALIVAEQTPNLVFDTSLVYTFDLVEPFLRRFGPDRLVFGTDLYSAPLGYRRNHVLGQLLDCDVPDDVKQAVLAGTLERLLGLPAATASVDPVADTTAAVISASEPRP
ncbi:amidohydrolase family protein [Yinghuangia soli]|uniref:Amidohydrolase family protein n=1 Tax=Yinghuangia soli TaxID=2908204 RepID=A0AA41Q601_9ACTN|nr:amidohydrolase family protein [Yinghuangia soli]MCF2531605.1 amidohydrolase family protein [Yinghuangia soli]